MKPPEALCVIMSTAGSQEEAERLADVLINGKLAACVQLLDITSQYFWEGKVCREPEVLLLIKTAASLYNAVEKAILSHHSYDVPEIIQIPVERGFDRYLGWVRENTQPVQER